MSLSTSKHPHFGLHGHGPLKILDSFSSSSALPLPHTFVIASSRMKFAVSVDKIQLSGMSGPAGRAAR